MKITAILSRVLLSLTFLTASMANATPLTWHLQGVTFTDGATASGSFDIESTTGDLLSWNIVTTPGILSGFTYDTSTSSLYARDFFSANSYLLINNAVFAEPYLNMAFLGALTAPGTIGFAISTSNDGAWECNNCFDQRFISAGSVTTDFNQVPEPAPVALFGIALAGLLARRKLQK